MKRAGRQRCFLFLPFVLLTEELYAVEFSDCGHEDDMGLMKWVMMRHFIVEDVILRLWRLAVAAGCMTLKQMFRLSYSMAGEEHYHRSDVFYFSV